MRFLLAAFLLMVVAAPAAADTCRRTGVTTRCSDGSATRLVNGRWLYRPAPNTQVITWTWPFIIPAREVHQVRQPRLVSPR